MIKIRKVEIGDIPALETLFLVTRQHTFHWESPDKFKLEDFKQLTAGEIIFVAEDEDSGIIGFISVWNQDTPAFIHHLFVSPSHQRKGVGELLLRSLFSWLPLPYRLKCTAKNLDAIAFYLKRNWVEVDRGISEDGEYLLLELPAHKAFSNISIIKATSEDKATIQNLGRFYVYDMSRYCGFLPGWEVPVNGLFECRDLGSYCEQSDRYAFLIKVDDELAGFVLINKIGSSPDVDWNIGEFFVVSKFQGKGVGFYVAEQIFSQFHGVWETTQMPENKAAIDFWEKVVTHYTGGQFKKNYKMIPKPQPHPMIVLKFASKANV